MSAARRLAAVFIVAVTAATTCVLAQAPRESWKSTGPQEEKVLRRLLGVLTYTTVTVSFDEMPAREAFDRLRGELGIPLIGRYQDDAFGYGLDPEAPVTLEASEHPAIKVLEDLLAQCSLPGKPCTWQMRRGYVEFGTRARLSAPAARDTRVYYVADLITDIPEDVRRRTRREVHALDVVQKICETVEPGAWDYGQELEPPEEEDFVRPPRARADEEPAGGDAGGGTAPPPRRTPTQGRHVAPAKTALIRYWRDVVIVHAPDYIHRQIQGYPEPIRP